MAESSDKKSKENAMQCQHIKRRTRAPRRHPYPGRDLPFDVVSEAAYCCVRLVPVGSAAPLRRSYDVAFHQVTGKPYCTPRGRNTYGPQRRASQRHRSTPSSVTWVWPWWPALQRISVGKAIMPCREVRLRGQLILIDRNSRRIISRTGVA
jgi:hypothetical protein